MTEQTTKSIRRQLKEYIPFNEQEAADKEIMIKLLKSDENIFTRENKQAHFTASSWIVSETGDKVLMVYHNIYDSWSWTGGHADGEENLLKVALKEVWEETGVCHVKALSEDIFSIEIITVNGHRKNGKYVPSHLHLNVTYLLEAKEDDNVSIKPDENSGVKWFTFDEALSSPTEPWMVERVYKKLINKLTWQNNTTGGTNDGIISSGR